MRFEVETRIAAPPSVVFAFHESPGALARLTPPWEHVQIVSGGDSIREGTKAVLRIWIGKIPVRWVVEHIEYEPNFFSFTDCQVQGPFARWYHRHSFLDDGRGGTWLRDEIDYDLPLGSFGRWLAAAYVRRKLRKLFAYRHQETRRIVEARDFPEAPAAKSPRDGSSSGTRVDTWDYRVERPSSARRTDIGRDIGSREIEVVK